MEAPEVTGFLHNNTSMIAAVIKGTIKMLRVLYQKHDHTILTMLIWILGIMSSARRLTILGTLVARECSDISNLPRHSSLIMIL
jgi:hypothetical protein